MSKEAIKLILPMMNAPEDAMWYHVDINSRKVFWFRATINEESLTIASIQEHSISFGWTQSLIQPEFLLRDDVIELPHYHSTLNKMHYERTYRAKERANREFEAILRKFYDN